MPRLLSPVSSVGQIINMIASVIEAIVMTVGSNTCENLLLLTQRRKFNMAKVRAGTVPTRAMKDISLRDTIAGVR